VPAGWYEPQARAFRPGDSVAVFVKAPRPVTVNGYATTWTVDGWLSPVISAQQISIEGPHESVRVIVVGRLS
jgi:hypothetical protein